MRNANDIPGFLAPVRQALAQPILMGGAPRAYAILNGTMAAIIAFASAPLWALPLGIICHFIGVFLAKRDPDFVEVLRRAMKIAARLEC